MCGSGKSIAAGVALCRTLLPGGRWLGGPVQPTRFPVISVAYTASAAHQTAFRAAWRPSASITGWAWLFWCLPQGGGTPIGCQHQQRIARIADHCAVPGGYRWSMGWCGPVKCPGSCPVPVLSICGSDWWPRRGCWVRPPPPTLAVALALPEALLGLGVWGGALCISVVGGGSVRPGEMCGNRTECCCAGTSHSIRPPVRCGSLAPESTRRRDPGRQPLPCCWQRTAVSTRSDIALHVQTLGKIVAGGFCA